MDEIFPATQLPFLCLRESDNLQRVCEPLCSFRIRKVASQPHFFCNDCTIFQSKSDSPSLNIGESQNKNFLSFEPYKNQCVVVSFFSSTFFIFSHHNQDHLITSADIKSIVKASNIAKGSVLKKVWRISFLLQKVSYTLNLSFIYYYIQYTIYVMYILHYII